jgi:DNA-binding cell septation regulator SpoVG
MKWSVKNYRKNTGRGKIKGWFTLVARDLEINDCTLVEGGKGDFIGLPQRSYQKDGETKYTAIVFIPDKDRRYAFNDWALKELDNLIRTEPEDGSGEDIPF